MDIEIREMKAIDYPKVALLLNDELGVNVNLEQFTSRIERMNTEVQKGTFLNKRTNIRKKHFTEH